MQEATLLHETVIWRGPPFNLTKVNVWVLCFVCYWADFTGIPGHHLWCSIQLFSWQIHAPDVLTRRPELNSLRTTLPFFSPTLFRYILALPLLLSGPSPDVALFGHISFGPGPAEEHRLWCHALFKGRTHENRVERSAVDSLQSPCLGLLMTVIHGAVICVMGRWPHSF